MRHQMNQFYYLEEEWNEKIPPKSNCCNDEFWSNASLSDEAPDKPIWFPRRRMRYKKYLPNLIVVMMNFEVMHH